MAQDINGDIYILIAGIFDILHIAFRHADITEIAKSTRHLQELRWQRRSLCFHLYRLEFILVKFLVLFALFTFLELVLIVLLFIFELLILVLLVDFLAGITLFVRAKQRIRHFG